MPTMSSKRNEDVISSGSPLDTTSPVSRAKPIRVIVVEDHPQIAEGLRYLLEHSPSVQLVALYATAEAALAGADDGQPYDVAIVDLGLPQMSGHELIVHLRQSAPDVEIVVFTIFGDDENLFRAIQEGATGYLLKDATAQQIVQAIVDVAAGGAPTSPEIARRILTEFRNKTGPVARSSAPRDRQSQEVGPGERTDGSMTAAHNREAGNELSASLTARETQVLELLAKGHTYDSIGRNLAIAVATVQSHVKSIYRKLNVSNKAEATTEGFRRGLLA